MSLSQSTNHFSSLIRFRGLATWLALFLLCGCGGAKGPLDSRAELCPETSTSHRFEETPYFGGTGKVLSFQGIRASINSSCASCHGFPAKTGGFTYLDSWQGKDISYNGSVVFVPGLTESAQKMRDYIFNEDLTKRMPPAAKRDQNPEIFLALGTQIDQWMAAGTPQGTFQIGKVNQDRSGKLRPVKPHASSDLGDCIPKAKAVGYDYKSDRLFEGAKALPKYLSETDLFTLDPLALAQRGTLGYNVEYPLWADNAEKGRWIHVPMKIDGGALKKKAVEFDSITGSFRIPENTRFYKTFYKAVTLPNKKIRMRRIETRLIVSRTPWENSLFGSYQWDDTEQIATLVEAPYRDGTAWKDVISDITVDEAKEITKPYAIPGRQRCIDCHMGSPMRNFVLGFTPLQIHKRAFGEAGRMDIPLDSDLDQVSRFISYGLIQGVASADELPVLEKSGGSAPRNIHELRANGYTVGNCFHCHNPNGLAFNKDNNIKLALGPGDIFSFDTHRHSEEISTRRLVHQNGELDGSQIWRKVLDPPAQQGMFSQMPMHTPYSPDCRVLTVIGKWIRSFESDQAADEWSPECKKENPNTWIDTDFTWPDNGIYTPRRNDWKDPVDGMPAKYRALELTSSLDEAIKTQYAVGYWLNKKDECTFPSVDLPPEKRRPWMMNGDTPKRPFGEVYYTTPGSYFFRNTCMKCHGPGADGNTSLARGILNWSGGSVRVANLIDGLFGAKLENLKSFDIAGKNYAANYLIWMAMEGTRVRFPPELSGFMGKHGGQMLNGIRDKCLAQIASSKASSPRFIDHEVFNKVCFMENLNPGHPDLAFDPATDLPLYPEKVEAWLDRGAWNAGWSIFEFLKDAGSGNWLPSIDQCERVYAKPKE